MSARPVIAEGGQGKVLLDPPERGHRPAESDGSARDEDQRVGSEGLDRPAGDVPADERTDARDESRVPHNVARPPSRRATRRAAIPAGDAAGRVRGPEHGGVVTDDTLSSGVITGY